METAPAMSLPARTPPPEMEVLDKLVGTWETRSTNKVSAWNPKETRTEGRAEAKRFLAGQFVLCHNFADQAEPYGMTIFTYNPQESAYRSWIFDALGNAVESAGEWDPRTNTLTFTPSGKPGASRFTFRFVDPGAIEYTIVGRDELGKTLIDVHGTWNRVDRPLLPNAFYAMDTAFRRPGLADREQYELVKELGYAGVAWHEDTPQQVAADLAAIETQGLAMFTIYCPARITPEGDLSYSQKLEELMRILSGHGTIIWLHIGGKGPAFDSLTGEAPVVATLRGLADLAGRHDLRIAIYPHLGEWTARFGDATRLAKLVNHPRFGVTFNLCHALAAGEETEVPALLEQAKDVLFTVTICGAQSGVTGGKWDQLIQTLDKGTFDVSRVLRRLKEIGFTGPIGFQGYGIEGDARAILTPTMRAWRELSAAAAGEASPPSRTE